MRKDRILYVGFYDFSNSKSKRVCSLAATNKMDYIASAINRAGYEVEILSPSWMKEDTEIKYEKQRIQKISSKVCVTFCPSWRTSNILMRNIKIMYSLTWLFFYLILNTKKGENVVAYHVQWISLPLRAAKFIKKFNLILEVEEIYQDVMIVNSLFTKWEDKLIQSADMFLYSTELLMNRINRNKPHITVYGVYNIQENINNPVEDGKIHLLYAGIIDSHKKGAFNALEMTKYLSSNYHLHMIGTGEIEKLCRYLNEYNKTNSCKATYDGMLSGVEYIKYCQTCHIGLSTQSMEGKYLETSFPSKILSYLSMGLRVVSCYVECVSKSEIGNLVTYYYQDDPEQIASAIRSINIEEQFDGRKDITELDKTFVKNFKKMLEVTIH